MSNFAMGTTFGKGFPQAQVHTVHSTSAEGFMLICERHHDYLLKDIFLVLQKKSYLKWQFFIL